MCLAQVGTCANSGQFLCSFFVAPDKSDYVI